MEIPQNFPRFCVGLRGYELCQKFTTVITIISIFLCTLSVAPLSWQRAKDQCIYDSIIDTIFICSSNRMVFLKNTIDNYTYDSFSGVRLRVCADSESVQ